MLASVRQQHRDPGGRPLQSGPRARPERRSPRGALPGRGSPWAPRRSAAGRVGPLPGAVGPPGGGGAGPGFPACCARRAGSGALGGGGGGGDPGREEREEQREPPRARRSVAALPGAEGWPRRAPASRHAALRHQPLRSGCG